MTLTLGLEPFRVFLTFSVESSSKRWLVLLSGCLMQAMLCSVVTAFGRLLIDIMVTFNATRAEASLIQSLMAGAGRGAGIFWGMATSRLGARNAGLIAASVSTAALFASYFATSLSYLVISIGIVFAGGASTLRLCTVVAVGNYFTSKTHAMALAVLITAAGIGSIIHSYFLGFLSDTYGLRGTFLILSGFSLNGVAFAWLWRSLEHQKGRKTTDNGKVVTSDNSASSAGRNHCEDKPVENGSVVSLVSDILRNEKAINGSGSTANILTETNNGIMTETISVSEGVLTFKGKSQHSYKDIKGERSSQQNVFGRLKVVLINRHFMIFCGATAIVSPSIQLVLVFLVDILIDKGFSESEASLVFILFNISSVLGRFSTGLIMKIPRMTAFSVPLIACLLAMIALWCLTFVQSFPLITVLCCAGGVAFGMFVSMCTVCTVALVGVKCFPEGVGFMTTAVGISSMLAGPTSCRDATGSYTTPLLIAAVAASIAFFMFLAGQCYKKSSTITVERRMSVFYVTRM